MLLSLKQKWSVTLGLLVSALMVSACAYDYIDREISGPVTLNQNWSELTPVTPLSTARDTHELTLFPDPPMSPDDPADKADITAELVSTNGKTYRSLPGKSETLEGGKIATRRVDFEVPEGLTYTRVRIQSTVPYRVKKILWRNYNWRDVHK
jgi:hypothetical protein